MFSALPLKQQPACSIVAFRDRANAGQCIDATACIMINVIALDFQRFRCF
jgi:hypothetical protein